MTRDGTVSLKIEIPRLGVTSKALSSISISHCIVSLDVERREAAFFLMMPSVFLVYGFVLVPMQISKNG